MKHELFNKVYVSETGNWVGRCMKCGIDLIIWTGAKSVLPEQHFISARRYCHGEIQIRDYGPCPGQKIAPGLFSEEIDYQRHLDLIEKDLKKKEKIVRDPLDRIPIGSSYVGLTTVTKREPTEDETIVVLDHAGNMGNTVQDIDDNLFRFCGIRVAELTSHPRHVGGEEWGSPDYLYQHLMRFSKAKGVPLRSSYFNTPIELGDTPRSVRQAWGRPWHMQKEGCCLYYYWGSMQRPHSIVKFIDGSAESIWSDATRGLITRGKGD